MFRIWNRDPNFNRYQIIMLVGKRIRVWQMPKVATQQRQTGNRNRDVSISRVQRHDVLTLRHRTVSDRTGRAQITNPTTIPLRMPVRGMRPGLPYVSSTAPTAFEFHARKLNGETQQPFVQF